MLTARTLPKIWCQVYDCQSTCTWENVLRAGVHHTVAMCEVHGIVALQLNSVWLRPFSFAMTKTMKAEQPKGKQPAGDLPCVRCGSKRANADCTFWLCKECCGQLRLKCSVGEHRDRGDARYADVAPHEQLNLRIADVAVDIVRPMLREEVAVSTHNDNDDECAIVHASCTHYTGDGVKKDTFDAFISMSRAAQYLHLRDFTTEAKRALGLAGVDLRRLTLDRAGKTPAFAANGTSPYNTRGLDGVATWSVCFVLENDDARRYGYEGNTANSCGKKRRMDGEGGMEGARKKSKR
ncbi:hypothetical protein EXIGLDRAFT_768289 [Exidia glandulosa HHB12029]|uniref:Uncharacterized protein n=1 Tax=Exidia glandulosa HHB12029 TaxID=1314781 RepID=A0A165IBF9_EXIGL|nr:hypothetical protein EXIGLDRAFT_768289 [Exidia glandulosa HHB12029]